MAMYDKYMGSNKLIKNAIKKYGIENFTKEIIDISDNEDDAYELEKKIVDDLFVARKDTYNISNGGRKASTKSQEHKDNISKAHMGKKYSDFINSKKANKGSKNGNARRVCIYNSENELENILFGNFDKGCIELGYPKDIFKKSLKNGVAVYNNSNMNRVRPEYRKYKGYRINYINN